MAKFFLSSPILNENRHVEISNEGIRTTSKLDSSLLTWSGIVKVTETLTEFLVYLGDEKVPGFFPKRAIEARDIVEVREYFRQFLGDRAQLLKSSSGDAAVKDALI